MLESIVATLKNAARSDAFWTKTAISYEDLSLEVEPIGLVQFPISARTAKALIVEADLAKFGKRDQTVLDRKIRDVWEIQNKRIKTNEAWNKKLKLILHQIQKNLELPEDGELLAELHNLLVYMPGQFFKGHQDTEKVDGMLATLVVLLPSEFSGGELVIDQHGDKYCFQVPSDIIEKITFIAFYADCHHEVKEVTSGYRVALTYNLSFKPSSTGLPVKANSRLEKELGTYFSTPSLQDDEALRSEYPRRLVYLLDHEYSQRSLGWQWLRGADRQRASEFLSCADNLNLQAHLVLADIHESWSTEGDDWEYRRHRRGRIYGKREDESEADISDEHALVEMIGEEIELRHWIDRDGHHVQRKSSFVSLDIVCWTKAVDEFRPFKREKNDWSILVKPSHPCADCRYLVDFLRSNIEQKLVWPLAEHRRQHIHSIIDEMDIPVTHETQRTGSPYKLVLTKTRDLFEKEEEHARREKECLIKFQKVLFPSTPD